MSRHGHGGGLASGILLTGLVWFGAPGEMQGQTPQDSAVAAVRTELDSLIPRMRALGELAQKADYRKRRRERGEGQLPVDTFTYGPFRLISLPEQRELAEEVFSQTWEELGHLVDGAEDLLQAPTFLVHYFWSREGMLLEGDSNLVSVRMSKRYPRSFLRRKAREAVGNVLMRGMPQALYHWSGGQPRAQTGRLPWVARELVVTASVAARRCYRGEVDGCAEAMGLNGSEGGWERWYSAEERRHYVERMGRPSSGRAVPLWEGCALAGMQEACEVLLRDRDPAIPLSTEARASLLGHALRTGGAGAFQRLRAAEDATIVDRLVAAAGVPRDSLLASWRSETLAATTSAWAGLARSPLAVLFWVVVLGALAARSTRWRLG